MARRANLATLFAPFDTPERAAAYVRLMGFYWRADDATTGLATERPSGHEFIVLSGSTCGGDVRRYQILVDGSGVVDTLRSRLYEKGDANCAI